MHNEHVLGGKSRTHLYTPSKIFTYLSYTLFMLMLVGILPMESIHMAVIPVILAVIAIIMQILSNRDKSLLDWVFSLGALVSSVSPWLLILYEGR